MVWSVWQTVGYQVDLYWIMEEGGGGGDKYGATEDGEMDIIMENGRVNEVISAIGATVGYVEKYD